MHECSTALTARIRARPRLLCISNTSQHYEGCLRNLPPQAVAGSKSSAPCVRSTCSQALVPAFAAAMQAQTTTRQLTSTARGSMQHLWPIRHPHLQSRQWQHPLQRRSNCAEQCAMRDLARQASSDSSAAVALASMDAAEEEQLPMPPQQQQPVIEYVGNIDGMQTVRGVLQLQADADLLYSLLTDYESSTRVFSNIASTEVLYGEDGSKQVLQACKWQFLALAGTFNLQLAVREEPSSRLLVFRLLQSSFMRDFEGRWQVTPAGPCSCTVEHVLAVKPLMPIPAAISQYTKNIFTRQVTAILADLSAEVGRQTGVQS